jgi:hypothetical protein
MPRKTAQDVDEENRHQQTQRVPGRTLGSFQFSTMIDENAITPSLNASSRPLFIPVST